jgi:hypothetical protein
MTWISLCDGAVATSGVYARGAHLIDARTGRPSLTAAAATVAAPDAVTANALATTLCLASDAEGFGLVERTPGAAALRVGPAGVAERTARFRSIERPRFIPAAAAPNWPTGFEMNLALTLTNGAPPRGRGGFGAPAPAGPGGRAGGPGGPGGRGPGASKRQYVAIWIENANGKLVRVLAFWADKSRYYAEMSSFFTIMGRNQNALYAVARATRGPGQYKVVWDGLDQDQKPTAPGPYRVVVETSQEHGAYAKQAGSVECGDKPAELTLSATANFEAVPVHYGPKPNPA